jgi:hypothetical protein
LDALNSDVLEVASPRDILEGELLSVGLEGDRDIEAIILILSRIDTAERTTASKNSKNDIFLNVGFSSNILTSNIFDLQ